MANNSTQQQMAAIVFIDGSLPDLQVILSGIAPSVTAIVLDPAQDGIRQMADALVDVSGVSAIHVISHGSSGQINLGTAQLSQNTFAQYQTQLATIGHALSDTGDLLLYGCNIAQGNAGQAFISALANATGADVAASTDLTGAAFLGGNWTLEAATGVIETTALHPDIAGVLVNNPPTATGYNSTVAAGTSIPLSQMFSYSDPDIGDSVTSFLVRDRTVGGGYLTLNGVAQAENTIFGPISISQIGQWAFVAGPVGTADTVGFNAYDSHNAISPSATASVTAQGAANNPPTATGYNSTVAAGTSIPLSQLFSYSDPDIGDSVTSFLVRDRTVGGGYLTLNGVAQAENTIFGPISISQIGQWAFVAGPGGAADTVGFNAYDSHNAISPSATATVTASVAVQTAVNNPPTATGYNSTVAAGTSIPLSQMFSYSDPDAGDSVTSFLVRDRTVGGGYLTLNGVAQAENTIFGPISISQIGQWAFVAGAGGTADTIGFNAYDSHNAISPSVTASVTASVAAQAAANNPPTATGYNSTVAAGTSIPLSQMFSYSDPDAGDSVTSFLVRDRTVGGGYLTLNGVAQAENTIFGPITISQIGQWAFVAGAGGAADTVGFNAYDSHSAISPSATATISVTAQAVTSPNGPVTPPPSFSISNAGSVTEGGNAIFTVSYTGTLTSATSVYYSTIPGTNASAALGDYPFNIVNLPLTFSPGGAASQTISVPILNDGVTEGDETFQVALMNTPSGAVVGYGSATIPANGPSTPPPSITDIPGSTATTAVLVVNGPAGTSTIDTSGDQDWWHVNLTAGTAYTFHLNSAANGGVGDAYLRLLSSSGTEITHDDDSGGNNNSLITYTPTTSGSYYLSAEGYGSNTGAYSLTATSVSVAPTPADNAGNTPSAARAISLTGSSQTWNDWVGSTDANDYYTFTLPTAANFQLSLTGLTADADVELLNSSGTRIAASTLPNNTGLPAATNDAITQPTLAAGTYY